MKPKYDIGDKVWWASRISTEERVVCPECFGKLFLTVILGDNSQVTIECAGCASGYNPPRGYITYWKQTVGVKQSTVGGIENYIDKPIGYKVNYTGCSYNCVKEDEVFDTREEAEKRALELAEQHNKEELVRIHRKEKNNRSWSWNAHYHRDCIRRAKKDIEYHSAKLEVAKQHQKPPTP